MTLLDDLKAIVGPHGWKTEPAELEPHVNDWRGLYSGRTPILVAPQTTDEVSRVVRRCAQDRVGIVPQGGNTSTCGGSVPDDSNTQIILSLSRMNRIREVDVDNFSMEVEAGCILENVQNAAKSAGRIFPLSLGAEGSCQIGGNLATNAGGINVLRYGTARAQVLGLEVVLASGEIVNGLRALRKDTVGYDLKQLFVGSEGTLGIITAATLRLYPDPGATTTAVVALAAAGDAVRLLSRVRSEVGDAIEAFELISDKNARIVEAHIPELRLPFEQLSPWYVLMEVATGKDAEVLEAVLAAAMEDGLVLDGALAKNATEAAELWRLRHAIPEAERAHGTAIKHDIAVPVSSIAAFLEAGDEAIRATAPGAELFAFGHVGDGNLHYNVQLPDGSDNGEQVTAAIYDLVIQFGGSISAEHGVGQTKREWMPRVRSDVEMRLMRSLKNTLDPDNILNPGKVI
ncbi:MAG: FAD-binding oxidoreductase [Pseudomonadota bacterium]